MDILKSNRFNAMQFYTIYPCEDVNRDFSFDLKGNQRRIIDFFKFDENNGFLNFPTINLTYDEELSDFLEDTLSYDFYYSSSGVLLFSKRFYQQLNQQLALECEFYKCLINGAESDIYALRIKNKMSILDQEERPKSDIHLSYIVKDDEKPYIYMVTDAFIQLVDEYNLKMNFLAFY